MGEEERPPSLDELGERLRAAQDHRAADRRREGRLSGSAPGMSGVGLAFRIGVELVSALAVGVGIGMLLDWWLGTRPWFLLVFFLLGAAAGMLNVYRAAMGLGLAVGYRKPGEAAGDETDRGADAGESAGGDAAKTNASRRSEGKQN